MLILKDLCDNVALIPIFQATQKAILLIQIIAPIVLIIFCMIDFTKLMANPEAKGGVKKIFNKFLAAAIIFFIPVFIDATMELIGENTKISDCWNKASNTTNP